MGGNSAIRTLGGIISLVVGAYGPAVGDAPAGEQLAKQWCVSCHVVGKAGRGGDSAPPFAIMADDPAYSPDRLRGWLIAPHPPMDGIHLSREQIEDVLDYIRSLRAGSAR